MSNIADLVKPRNKDKFYLITDIMEYPGGHYMFQLYDLERCACESWFEPFDNKLNTDYWDTLG